MAKRCQKVTKGDQKVTKSDQKVTFLSSDPIQVGLMRDPDVTVSSLFLEK